MRVGTISPLRLSIKGGNKVNIYKRAVDRFGEESRLNLMMEEAAELIQACSKEQRGLDSNINEEIADVEIMLEQLKYCKCYDRQEIDAQHNIKVKLLEGLICR